jgi:hypothetical protein
LNNDQHPLESSGKVIFQESLEQLPDVVRLKFNELIDSLDGTMSKATGTHERIEDEVDRYRLKGELRNKDTRALSASTFIVNMTNGFYIPIIMTADERDGEILNSEIVRDRAGWGNAL